MPLKDPEARKQYQARWYLENQERLLAERKLKYQQTPSEKLQEKRRRVYWSNPEVARERSLQYYADNRSRILADQQVRRDADPSLRQRRALSTQQWQKDNPERARARNMRYQMRKSDNFVEDVHSLVVLEMHDGVCGICKEDVDPFDFHVDHVIPLAKGGEHSYANTQPAHPGCNCSKGNKIL